MNTLVLLFCITFLCRAEKNFLPLYTPSSHEELNKILCAAVRKGDANLIGFFHTHFPGAWRNITCENWSPLERAVIQGNGLAVRTLLVLGAHKKDLRYEENLLHRSSFGDERVHALVELLDVGFGVDQVDRDGTTALANAVMRGANKNVIELLAAGADPRKLDRFGISPVAIAMEDTGINDTIVAALLGATKIPESLYRSYHCNFKNVNRYPLKYIDKCEFQEEENTTKVNESSIIQDYLLRTTLHLQQVPFTSLNMYTEYINSTDIFSRTPLHEAARLGNRGVVRVLLELGADVHATDWLGRTPLHWASLCRRTVVKQLLLKRGANPSVLDRTNQSPENLEQRL